MAALTRPHRQPGDLAVRGEGEDDAEGLRAVVHVVGVDAVVAAVPALEGAQRRGRPEAPEDLPEMVGAVGKEPGPDVGEVPGLELPLRGRGQELSHGGP